jgi:NACalpha-BTF3-like transcription factor
VQFCLAVFAGFAMAEGDKQQKQLKKLQAQATVETTIYGAVDAAGQKRLQDIIQKTAEQEYVAEQQRLEHEAKLKAVKLNPADVALLQAQFVLSKPAAERKLRTCAGDVSQAIRELIGV